MAATYWWVVVDGVQVAAWSTYTEAHDYGLQFRSATNRQFILEYGEHIPSRDR